MRLRTFDELLDKQIKILLTKEQHERLLKLAAASGMNMTDYIRPILLKQIEKDEVKHNRRKAA